MSTEKVCIPVTNSRADGYKTNQYEKNFLSDQKITSKNLPKNSQNSIDLENLPGKTGKMVEKLQCLGFNEQQIKLIINHPKESANVPKALAELARIAVQIHAEILNYLASCESSNYSQLHSPLLIPELRELGLSEETIAQLLSQPEFVKYAEKKLKEYQRDRQKIIGAIRSFTCRLREIAKSPTKKRRKKRKSGKPRKEENDTLNKQAVFAALYEEPEGIDIYDMAKKAKLTVRRLRDTLKKWKAKGFIIVIKRGQRHYYVLTHRAIFDMGRKVGRFFKCDIPKIMENTHLEKRHTSPKSLATVISIAKLIYKELTNFGWYHHRIREACRRHRLVYILKLIERVKSSLHVKTPGAYLYSILITGVSKANRIKGLANTVLAEIQNKEDGALAQAFNEETDSMEPKEIVHFACSIRKLNRRSEDIREARAEANDPQEWTFTKADVHGIASYIRKCEK